MLTDLIIGGLYGLLTLGVVVLSHRGASSDARGASLILLGTWAISNVTYLGASPFYGLWPAMDAVVIVVLAVLWRERLSLWMIGLLACLLGDMFTHLSYLSGGDFGRAAATAYNLTLNALYIGQLASVASASLRFARS